MQPLTSQPCTLEQALAPHLAAGATYCVALSGGGDSVALLHALASLRGRAGFSLVALHLNHCLRGSESDADEQFCRAFCRTIKVPVRIKRMKVGAFATRHKMSLEDAGRRCRFEWFACEAGRLKAAAVFLAHHADDQAETVLLRLFRGAGVRGLAGMKHVARFKTMTIIRPWLGFRRRALDGYRAAHGLACRHDSSNDATRFERNWIRKTVMPAIAKRFGDGVADRIGQSACVCREVEDHLMAQASLFFNIYGCTSVLGLGFPMKAFADLDGAVQRAVLRLMLDRLHGWDRQQIEFDALEAVRLFALSDAPELPRPLPQPLHALKAYGHVFIGRIQPPALETMQAAIGRDIALSTGAVLRIERVARRGRGVSDNGEAWHEVALGRAATMIQYASLPARARIAVRPRSAGDRYRPVHGHERKVKELLIEAGVPQWLKETVPVLAANGEPVWLAGWRIADAFKTKQGALVYRLSLSTQGLPRA